MTYFTFVEVLCRRGIYICGTIDRPGILLRLPFLFVGDNQQQLIPTWPLTKAYASAFASWVKAYIMLLGDLETSAPPSAAAAPAGGGQAAAANTQAPGAAAVTAAAVAVEVARAAIARMQNQAAVVAVAAARAGHWVGAAGVMLTALDDQLIWLGTEITQSHAEIALCVGEPFAHWRSEWEGAAVEPIPSSLQLLLLLWLGRGVLLAAQRLIGMVPTASKNRNSSSRNKSTKQQQQQAERQSDGKDRGFGNDVTCKEEADTSGARSSNNSSGIATGTTCAGTAAATKVSSGGTSSSGGTAPVPRTSRFELMQMLTMTAVRHCMILGLWQKMSDRGVAAGGPATEGYITATAAAAECDIGEGSSSRFGAGTSAAPPAADDAGTAAHRAAAAAGRSSSDQLPKRLAKMPTHSLPAAVAAQLSKVASAWPAGMMSCEVDLPEDAQQLQQFLQDLLDFEQVLLLEVPSPIGCNNPACVNLEGDSEAKNSLKMCSGCKVGYCSRECQVAHWKVHKEVCEKLQKQAPGASRVT